MPTKIIKYLNFIPCMGKNIQSSSTSVVIGNTHIEDSTKLKKNVIIRGDGKKIKIGKNCLLSNRVTIHVTASMLGTTLGNNCIIGEFSIIHACKLNNKVLVGSNSVIMDGSEIGNNVVIMPNSLVPPRKKFPSYSLIGGSPAKIIKKINKKEFLAYENEIIKSQNLSIFKNIFNYRDFINKKVISTNKTKAFKEIFIAPDAKISECLTIKKKSI